MSDVQTEVRPVWLIGNHTDEIILLFGVWAISFVICLSAALAPVINIVAVWSCVVSIGLLGALFVAESVKVPGILNGVGHNFTILDSRVFTLPATLLAIATAVVALCF